MDSFHGMEVGAEVELNDGTLEDHSSIKLENKRDLPLWQHIHHFDDSSSDESLDQQYGISTHPEISALKMPRKTSKIKNMCVSSTLGSIQPGHSLVLNNNYSKNLQEQASQLAPYLEDPGIYCTEVSSSPDLGQLPPYYTETTSSDEENPRQSLRKQRNSDCKPQCNKSLNLFRRDFKCEQCGRQFRHAYNLEHHLCIDMSPRCPQQNGNNVETMNRLAKMCEEAQKELQSLQDQYRKEVLDTLPSSSKIQTCSQELVSASGEVILANQCTIPSDPHEFESESIYGEEFHISCADNIASQNLTDVGNTIVVDLTNCSPLFLDSNQKQDSARQIEGIQLDQLRFGLTNLNQSLSFQTSVENQTDSTSTYEGVQGMDTTKEATKFYKYQEYDEGSSITQVESSLGGQESDGTSHNVTTALLSLNSAEPTPTFTCEYCGKVFNRRCSYATHTSWHLRKKDSVTVDPTQETGQVSSLPIENQNGDSACTTLVEIYTCQSCGSVFNEHCAYINHSHLHVKEHELHKRIIAEAQRMRLAEDYLKMGIAKTAEVPNANLDDGSVQGYCRLVRQLSLEEQHNPSSHEQLAKKSEEPSSPQIETNQQTLPEVLESVLELVVGTEEVHEILLSKAGLVFRKAEDYGNAEVEDVAQEDVAQFSETRPQLEEETDPGAQSKPEEKLVPGMFGGPEKKTVLGTLLEPAEEQIPGTHSEPEDKKVFETHLEPVKKPNSLQVFPTKLTALRLSRTKLPHRCRDCGLRFQQFWRLRNHRHKGLGKVCTLKKHQCDCGRTPIGSLHFLLHQLQHLSDTAFICAVCSKPLNGYRQLQAHSRVHPLVSQFQCKCGARFTKLPKYLWHSLKNKAKPKTNLQRKGCNEASLK